jgi:manganese/iron transport system permease protein
VIASLLLGSVQMNAVITATALGIACAALSVIVVLRGWSFIGEGISHAGFGGIGTAWLVSLALPGLANQGGIYFIAVLFCLSVALAIGFFTRRETAGAGGSDASPAQVGADSVIGIFLVASLAWGFIALAIYQRHGHAGVDWERYLLGNLQLVSHRAMMAAICVSAAVLLILAALRKEILLYTFDPLLAEVSGVPARFVHYLLMVMLAGMIVVGMGLVGNLLVPAMLILPGTAALLLSRRLVAVVALAMLISLIGAVGGCLVTIQWQFLPAGPAIALILFIEFLIAYIVSRIRAS